MAREFYTEEEAAKLEKGVPAGAWTGLDPSSLASTTRSTDGPGPDAR